MAFKISLLPDFRAFTKGMSDVEKSFDDVADSLDDLARETKVNSDKAADALTRDFKQAFDKVERESEQAGKSIGRDFKRGTDKAGEGLDEFKDEANQTAKEAAASFDGSAESIADIFQELGANAFAGFGPAGAAAGIAAAAGIGIVISQLQEAEEKAHEATERVASLVDELAEVDGDPAMLDWATRLRDLLKEVTDPKQWFEFWQAADKTRYDAITESVKKYNLTQSETNDLMLAHAGNSDAAARSVDMLNRKIEEQKEVLAASTDQHGNYDQSVKDNITSMERERDTLNARSDEMNKAKEANKQLTEAEQNRAEAQREAKAAQERFNDSLKDGVSVLDDYSDIIKDGEIDFGKWAARQKQAARDNKLILEFDSEAKLTPEARQHYRDAPREQQIVLAKEWKKGGKKAVKVETLMNNEVTTKTDWKNPEEPKQTMNDSLSSKYGWGGGYGITVPVKTETQVTTVDPPTPTGPIVYTTSVNEDGATTGAQRAADNAQRIANEEKNKIEFKTKIKSNNLQGDVDRVAASIHSPTIYVNVKTRKDVP